MREPVELTYAKCYELLAAGGLGRAAVCTPTGPHIVPVNYSVVDESVIGGIVARVGDVVIDGTVSNAITELRQAVLSR